MQATLDTGTCQAPLSEILIVTARDQERSGILRAVPCEFSTAGDCRAALARLERSRPRVILCDHYCPTGPGAMCGTASAAGLRRPR